MATKFSHCSFFECVCSLSFFAILPFASVSHAGLTEICTAGSSFSSDHIGITYTIGAGSKSGVEVLLRASSKGVRRTLETAARNRDASVRYCMRGRVIEGVFLVLGVTVDLYELLPTDTPSAANENEL